MQTLDMRVSNMRHEVGIQHRNRNRGTNAMQNGYVMPQTNATPEKKRKKKKQIAKKKKRKIVSHN